MVIDVHTHLAPQLCPSMLSCSNGVHHDADGQLVIDHHVLAHPGLYDAPRLVRTLGTHDIDRAWVSAPPATYRQGMDASATKSWVRALDAGMRARIGDYPTLGLLSYLPLDQPAVASELIDDLAFRTGNVGWTASAGGASLPLDDDALSPLWAQLAAIGKPVLLHPGESPDGRLRAHYLANLLGNPVETGVAAAQLVLGGVLVRHPGLKLVLVHCGGIVPAVVGRWARGVATGRPGLAPYVADPRETVRLLWADTLAHSPAAVDLAVSVFGIDRLLLGSDYPFPMGFENPFESIAHLDASLREQVAGNAAVLLLERTDS
ncbi:amidohydrolase family protein [Mycolicibacterium sp. XJ2546]